MRRALHIAVESGTDNPAPGVYPNVCGSAQPGRSFCFRGLTGEYLESDRIPLGTLRVWLSKQWGMNIDWLMQEPNAGATLKYWRALCSRLFLLDVTSFAQRFGRSGELLARGARPLPARRSDAGLASLLPQSDLEIDTPPDDAGLGVYGQGPRLLVVSNQGADEVVESVQVTDLEKCGAGGVQHYYDAETGEEIEIAAGGAIRLHIPGNDYRLVLGFASRGPSP